MTEVADTNQHYDLDPEVFGEFLDPLRKYSSGRYLTDTDTLEQAQRHKLRFVAGRLRLSGGERVLDAGCGWGSLVLFMAEEFACQTVGVSPAPRQHEYIAGAAPARGGADRVGADGAPVAQLGQPPRTMDARAIRGA
ncbi:SAM-dependent methyltransferase, partial [Nocardia sp. NPDC056541]|uniref:SAM-dependent methyltransferase n=1 Tax=Nocardia sp. NPDC056541 TaxID=3345860 RepID=UPI00366AF388